jgi:pimeloyl-ACP methyl ester carboxylesterase
MSKVNMLTAAAGYTHNGMPYNRYGHGSRILVVFQGLLFENKPLTGFLSGLFSEPYKSLEEFCTIYIVNRKPGMPKGYSMKDIADDYAAMIEAEFNGPVDVLGVSTGGSIVQHFAADHPDLVRKLIIHSSAYTLSEYSKMLQLRVESLASQRKWRAANMAIFNDMLPSRGFMKYALKPVVWLGSMLMGTFGAPKDPNDLVVTIEAEDKHNFKDRLSQITAPTLVIAGDQDPFYTEALFRETATGIPNARLILYKGMGHPASGKQFSRDVLAFLSD